VREGGQVSQRIAGPRFLPWRYIFPSKLKLHHHIRTLPLHPHIMFAVPGWSVSASSLKAQVTEPSKSAPNKGVPASNSEDAEKSSKKRKSSSGKSKEKDVNGNNLADLWESFIEGKKKSKKHDKKRQKVERDSEASAVEKSESNGSGVEKKRSGTTGVVAKQMIAHSLGIRAETTESRKKVDEGPAEIRDAQEDAMPKDKKHKKYKNLKEKRREKKAAPQRSADGSASITKTEAPSTTNPVPAPKTSQLTPLQASMRQKLISARFRHLNQTLYTTSSSHSLSLFQENPEMFTEYHEGFRRQVEVWPENPVDSYISNIKTRGNIRGPQRRKPEKKTESILEGEASLPRTEGTSTIADLGCGDATLSTALQPHLKKLHLKIHSFDLQSPSPLVTKADIANLPLADGSVDVAIFCLALMGINWIDFIEEAFRILRWKGELWVAEIKSRFGRVGGKGKRVEHSVGNRKHGGPEDKKEKKKAEEESNDLIAAVEVDGVEDKGGETDVSAFVEVLRKRGFVLKEGEGGVDLRNKMFVKMCFVKGATPVKGKFVPVPKGMEKFGRGMETWKKKPKGKFIDDEEEHVLSEAGVLKPCVYKLR
jgi:ribosomal RNA-processing protein 8